MTFPRKLFTGTARAPIKEPASNFETGLLPNSQLHN